MKSRLIGIFLLLGTVINLQGQNVQTGIDHLQASEYQKIEGKRVGLITNPTGVNRVLESTIDLLHEAINVELTALYGPEHGVRGDYSAGDKVETTVDKKTGVPVYSLYGKTKKPTPEMLQNVDVLIYDIQDIGSRSYTYISTLGLAMEAAAENNIPFIVLDRPNPLGGERMEGMITEPEFTSFVSQFPIPYIHGLTVGELAKFLNGEKLLKNGIQCELTVIEMEGWKRSMTFMETELPWVASSPHIPNPESAFFYPISGIIGELYDISIGVGYTMPFQTFAATWIDADKLCKTLKKEDIPGIIFRPIHYKPYYSTSKGTIIHGVQVHITDYNIAPLSLIQFYVLQACHELWPDEDLFERATDARISMFDKVCGSDKVRKNFTKEFKVSAIEKMWTKDIPKFRKTASNYFLY